jgi:hypothetical protein
MKLYPSDNDWDIPTLRLDRQPAHITAPVLAWGSVPRGHSMPGTWSFYVDDYRFSAILREPTRLAATECTAAVEPNITRHDHTPRALVLEATYRRRLAARSWQELGVDVFVDLNVPRRHRELCMLGVPAGWRAFATRGYTQRPDDLRDEHAFATEWAGGEPLLLVVGGGAGTAALCRELSGAIFAPDYSAQKRAVAIGHTDAATCQSNLRSA